MAGSLNKVLLIGRLGADPEIKQMVNGKSVARISLATSQSWKDKNTGEKKEKTEWHRVVVFNEGLVNVVQQYLKKGAQVYVEGQLSTRKWKDEQSGQDKYSTEIVIQGYNSSLTMLGGGNSGIEAALDLSGIVKSVTVLEFLPELKADQLLIKRAEEKKNIYKIAQAYGYTPKLSHPATATCNFSIGRREAFSISASSII